MPVTRAELSSPSISEYTNMFDMIHGRKCVNVNGRWYAVNDRNHGLADRIAMRTNPTSNVYERVQRSARNNNTRGFR
jgi:hypothetical protein